MTQTTNSAPVYDAPTVGKLLGITSNEQELAAFGPPPKPVEGFITFFDPGWSILRLREAAQGKGPVFWKQSWFDTHDFAKLEEKPRYRQLRTEAGKDSFGKTFAEQQKLLSKDEEVPLARVVLAAVVIHFLGSERRLFPRSYVRTADQTSVGSLVLVGYFDRDGVGVGGDPPDRAYTNLGVALTRNVP